MHKLVKRGKEGARLRGLIKQHPHKPRGPLMVLSYIVSQTGWQDRRCISPLRCCLLAGTVTELLGWCPGSSVAATGSCYGYLGLLSGHVELSQPCLQGLGVAPWPIILSSPFCLSHKDIYTIRFFHWACFTDTLTAHFSHCLSFWICKVTHHGVFLQARKHTYLIHTDNLCPDF